MNDLLAGALLGAVLTGAGQRLAAYLHERRVERLTREWLGAAQRAKTELVFVPTESGKPS